MNNVQWHQRQILRRCDLERTVGGDTWCKKKLFEWWNPVLLHSLFYTSRVPVLLTFSVLPFSYENPVYMCTHTHIYIYVCVCVCNMRKSIHRWCILISIRILNNARHSTNPSTIQSRASPRVYMRVCNSSVIVRTTHKPERLAQYRARATAWMIIELGFDSTAENRFCVRDFVQNSFRTQTPPLQIGPSWVGEARHHPQRTHPLHSGCQDHPSSKNSVQKTVCCNSTSNAPDVGRMYPKHVELRIHQLNFRVASSWHFTLFHVVWDLRLSIARVTYSRQDPLEINCHSEDEKAWRFATVTHICLYNVALCLPCFIGITTVRITEGQSLASGRDMAYRTQRQFDNAE